MKTIEQKEQFIQLRAKGYSFDKIAEQLEVSKPTLIKWNGEFLEEVKEQIFHEYDKLLNKFKVHRLKRFEQNCKLLNAVHKELDKRTEKLERLSIMELEKLKVSLVNKIEDWVFNCLYMPIDKLNDCFMKKFAEKAARFKPVMLRGYAGGTYVFAKFLLKNNNNKIRPEVVVSTGDTLYPHYREAIEKAFLFLVLYAYGGDVSSSANQCPEGSYHILPSVYLELADKYTEGNEQWGTILLTSLTNYAMPMIRYNIADIGVTGQGVCACGRSWDFLKKIVGRQTDIVLTPSGNRLVCHHFNNILRLFDGVDQFQVVQKEPSEIILRLATNGEYNKQIDDAHIIKSISELGGNDFTVKIENVDSIPAPQSGKRRYIISTVEKSGET